MRLARRKIKKGASATIEWYSDRFRVDRRCATKELMQLGHCTVEEYIREGGIIMEKVGTGRRMTYRERERLRIAQGLSEGYWVEGGQAPEYGISFIAGFTEGGCPYGLSYEQIDPGEAKECSCMDEEVILDCIGTNSDKDGIESIDANPSQETMPDDLVTPAGEDEVPF